MNCKIEENGCKCKVVLCFLEYGDVFLSGAKYNRVSIVKTSAKENTCNHFGHVVRDRGRDVAYNVNMNRFTDSIDGYSWTNLYRVRRQEFLYDQQKGSESQRH